MGQSMSHTQKQLNDGAFYVYVDHASTDDPIDRNTVVMSKCMHWSEVSVLTSLPVSPTYYLDQPLAAAGVPSPTSFHLQLRLNGGFWGLFSFVEPVDKTFLSRVGLDPEGPLFKAVR